MSCSPKIISLEYYTSCGLHVTDVPYDILAGTCIADCIADCGFENDEFKFSFPESIPNIDIAWIKYHLAERIPYITYTVRMHGDADMRTGEDAPIAYIAYSDMESFDFYNLQRSSIMCDHISKILGADAFNHLYVNLKALDFLGLLPSVCITTWRYEYYEQVSNAPVAKCVPITSVHTAKTYRGIFDAKKYRSDPLDTYYDDMDDTRAHPFDEEDDRMRSDMDHMYQEFLEMSI